MNMTLQMIVSNMHLVLQCENTYTLPQVFSTCSTSTSYITFIHNSAENNLHHLLVSHSINDWYSGLSSLVSE